MCHLETPYPNFEKEATQIEVINVKASSMVLINTCRNFMSPWEDYPAISSTHQEYQGTAHRRVLGLVLEKLLH